MKLIDILVEELPKCGGWPEGAARLAQDPDGDIQMLSSRHAYLGLVGWTGDGRDDFYGQYAARKIEPLASDYTTAIITSEQYDAALEAKNEGWIEWGGGECPVEEGTRVDVRYRNGEENHHVRAGISFDYTGSNPDRNAGYWYDDGSSLDIIAYRLHQPQEAAQDKAGDEDDLNERIGHDVAPVWNGEGLPPVGVECEYKWQNDRWRIGKVCYISKHTVLMLEIFDEEESESAYGVCDVTFRPLHTEAERKREAAIEKLTSVICGEIPDTGMATAAMYAARIYDAGYRKDGE